jgi:predicted ATPase
VGRIQHGYSLALEGKTDPGIAEMLEGLTTVHAAHALAALAQSHCWLSESYVAAGRAEDARKALADGFAAMENTGERMFEAELQRVRGEIALICEPPQLNEAERSFRIAIDTARSSGAKLWEIRAAKSLAALLSKHGRQQEAVGLLAPVYASVPEADIADLRRAKSILDQLGA